MVSLRLCWFYGAVYFVYFFLWTVFKVFLNLLQSCFPSVCWHSGCQACGLLAAQPGSHQHCSRWKAESWPLDREGGPCFLFFVYLLLRVYEKIWNLVPSFPLTQKFLRSLQTQLRLHHLLFLDVFRFPGSGIAASLCS